MVRDGVEKGLSAKSVVRKVATITLVMILVVSSVQAATTVVDDFEGGIHADTVGSGWTTSTTTYAEGGEAGYFDSSSTTTNGGLTYKNLSSSKKNYTFYYQRVATSSDTVQRTWSAVESGGSRIIDFQVRDSGWVHTRPNTNIVNTSIYLEADRWYLINVVDIDYSNSTYDVVIQYKNGTEYERHEDVAFYNSNTGSDIDELSFTANDDSTGYLDHITLGGYEPDITTFSVSGEVVDSNNEELSNANITVKNASDGSVVATDTTDHLGKYSVQVENGTYNVTASKTDYTEETKKITVDGDDETANFKLKKFNQSIQLDVRMYMEHGQVSPYEVVVSLDGDRRDVTGEANVTSGDTNVVKIDSSAHEVIATSNTSINSRTYVRAEWTDSDGNTYTTERNVTVANATVENIQILPTFTRFSASISDETLMVIIIATGFGAAASLFSTSFAGIAAMTMLMLLGWLAGYVHNGMAIVTVLSAMFIGMNVAGNVDYTVRR